MSEVLQPGTVHDLGKLLLAFIMLWAYVNFSQFLIVWSGNLSEETPFYIQRLHGGWGVIAVVLLVFHFVLPLRCCCSRGRSSATPGASRSWPALMLVMQLVDLYWLIGPDLLTQGHGHAPLRVHWMDLAAPLGMGGLWLFLFARQLRARPVLPLGEPAVRALVDAADARRRPHERAPRREPRRPVREGGHQRAVHLLVRVLDPRAHGERGLPAEAALQPPRGPRRRERRRRPPTWPSPTRGARAAGPAAPGDAGARARARSARRRTRSSAPTPGSRRTADVARIPIDEAMRIVAEEGLPAFPAPAEAERRGDAMSRSAARRARPRGPAGPGRRPAGPQAPAHGRGSAGDPQGDRLGPAAGREDPARPRLQGRDRQGRRPRRLLRRQARGPEPGLLRVPDAVHDQPERPGEGPRGPLLRPRPGVRGAHRELRPERGDGAGGGEEAGLHGVVRQERRGGAGLALPDRGRGVRRPR